MDNELFAFSHIYPYLDWVVECKSFEFIVWIVIKIWQLYFQPVFSMDEGEKIAYASEFFKEMATCEFSYLPLYCQKIAIVLKSQLF